jgi:hypothetical protein
MKRLAVLGLVVLVTLAVTAVSAVVHRDLSDTNDFALLGILEPFVVLVGGIAALGYLVRQRDNARGVLGVGLYSLIIGTTFVTVFSGCRKMTSSCTRLSSVQCWPSSGRLSPSPVR